MLPSVINSNHRYRIVLPEESISITETVLWKLWQKISHYRYRYSLEFQIITITDTDFENSAIILATTVSDWLTQVHFCCGSAVARSSQKKRQQKRVC